MISRQEFERRLACLYKEVNERINEVMNESVTIDNIVTATSIYDLPIKTTYVTHTGSNPATWILPAIVGNAELRLILINQGTGLVTINSNTGAADIADSDSMTNTLQIAFGEHYILYNNSIKYTTL